LYGFGYRLPAGSGEFDDNSPKRVGVLGQLQEAEVDLDYLGVYFIHPYLLRVNLLKQKRPAILAGRFTITTS
jgi:hypothetical protein